MDKKLDLAIIAAALLVSLTLIGLSGRNVARAQAACDIDCLSDKIAALTRRVVALEKLVGGGAKTTKAAAGTKENFMYLSGGGAAGVDWTKIEGTTFWFDQSLYGEVTEVTYSGWVESGDGQVRLYDATNNRAVDGSEISVSASGRASFYSSPLAIWRGQNQYYIQVKNVNVQTVTITTPRLRILSKN